jgi:hypothetical protein
VSERSTREEALARVREIARQLHEIEARAATASTEVELSLVERAAELADEAARLLEEAAGEPS